VTVHQDTSQTTERQHAHDRFAEFERGVLQDNIALCDTKAGLLLAFTSAMVLFSIETFLAVRSVAVPRLGWITLLTRFLLIVAPLGFLVSAQLSLTTVMPRIRRGAGNDHIFWESPVFQQPVDDYVATMTSLDPDIERTDKLRHLHLLAAICRRKFAHFRSAMHLAQAAFLALAAGELLRVYG
jgi:hypothetical protein